MAASAAAMTPDAPVRRSALVSIPRAPWLAGLLALALIGALGAGVWRWSLQRGSHLEAGSSYRSLGNGTRALYLLLSRLGYRVSRLQRAPFLEDARAQLLSIGPEEAPESPRRAKADGAAMAGFIARGGRVLILSRSTPLALLEAMAPGAEARHPPRRTPAHGAIGRPTPSPPDEEESGAAGAPTLRFRDPDGRDVWLHGTVLLAAPPPGARPLLTAGARVAAYSLAHGKGEFLFVASSDPATNAGLAEGENLEFVLSLLDRSRPVLFDEFRHGFDEEETLLGLLARYGLRALPWQLGLVLLLLVLRGAGEGRAEPEPAAAVREGAREDLVRAVARLAARFVPETEAAEAFRNSFRVRLTDPRLPAARARFAAARLEELGRRRPGLVETHRVILDIEAELKKGREEP